MPLSRALPIAVAGLALAGCAAAPLAETAAGPDRCLAAADAAARSLIARIEPQGRFRYRIAADGRLHDGYNIVRHAGSIWALTQVSARTGRPLADPAAVERASTWLADCCLRTVPGDTARLAIWSSAEGEPLKAKLGASGLALAAWSARRRLGLPAPGLDELRPLAAFIVSMQGTDGRFTSRFLVDRPDDRWQSLYYPGEAALGLLGLAAIDPTPAVWVETARRSLQALAEARLASGDWPPDHWALIATHALQAHDAGLVDAVLTAQARAIAERLLAEQRADGSFEPERRSAPAATRLEALIAAAALLGTDAPALRARLDAAISRGSRFLFGLQTRRGALAGAVPRAAPNLFSRRAGEWRIDDTQHALSVWLGASALQNDSCKRV